MSLRDSKSAGWKWYSECFVQIFFAFMFCEGVYCYWNIVGRVLCSFPNIPGTVSRGSTYKRGMTPIYGDHPHTWGSGVVHFLGTGQQNDLYFLFLIWSLVLTHLVYCWHPASLASLPVHTSPWHRIRHRTFIFGILM